MCNINIDGEVKTKNNKKFIRIINGFNDNSPIITDRQIADLIGYSKGARSVRQRISSNIEKFILDKDIKDIKRSISENNKKRLKETGYTIQSINLSSNIYIFSHEGFIKFLQMSDINGDYSEFEKSYFGYNLLNIVNPMRYELAFKYDLDKIFKDIYNFIPQYPCCNNKYKIDFYCMEKKLAIEYDEEEHNYRQIKDKNRESEIHNELGCDFIRVKKREEMQGINLILKYIYQ